MKSPTNSLVPHLVEYVRCLFLDTKHVYTRPHDWARDQARLTHELVVKGERVLTLDLPAVGKHFDKCLAGGRLRPSGLLLQADGPGKKVPRFLGNLLQQVFHPSNGVLREDASIEAVVSLRQIFNGAKKLKLQCPERSVNDEVLSFIKVESEIRVPTLNWDGDLPLSEDPRLVNQLTRPHLLDGAHVDGDQLHFDLGGEAQQCAIQPEIRMLQSVFDRVCASLGDFSNEKPDELPKHGPGVVSDRKMGETKYLFRDWPSKLDYLYPYDRYATHDFMLGGDLGSVVEWRNHEVPSRLISVPKTMKAPRLIAAEPSSHQWIQQLIWKQLEARIGSSLISKSISFRSQSQNQNLALSGSLDGGYATIDLSSASDRLSCWVVERFCRANFTLLDRLHASRTRVIRNGVNPSLWQYAKLKKFSTMGSACIFPMQTVIYASIAISSILTTKGWDLSRIEEASRLCSVFGDDIIVPSDCRCTILALLAYVGLKVNNDKSFFEGNFRESCGVDAFRGHDVTPSYLAHVPRKARAVAATSFIEVSNNFHMKGMWHVAAWLRTATKHFDHMIPVVSRATDALGYKSFCGTNLNHLSQRWSVPLHRVEVRVLCPRKKVETTRSLARHDFLQWVIEAPAPDQPWQAGTRRVGVEISRPGWRSIHDYFGSSSLVSPS